MNEEFLGVFAEESGEELEKIEQLALSLGPEKLSVIPELMRLFHTIKGNSRLMELTDFSDAAHTLEDCLKAINDGTLKPSPDVTNFILKGKDLLKAGLKRIAAKQPPGIDIEALLKGFEALKSPTSKSEGVRVEIGENELNVQSVRVPTESLDKVLRCVGQLNTKVSTLKSLQESFDEKVFSRNLREAELLVKQLQDEVLEERMFPLETIFGRFPRMVRELAIEQGKKINLIIRATDVKLDKSVLEIINDPMVHILRNAVDHGIETPDERKKNGKSEEGIIEISTEKFRDSVIINIKDDGNGIDQDAIVKKATEMGYVKPGTKLSKEEILKLVGRSGLSTKPTASKLSGRGVGMDIVYNNIKRIGGNLNLESEKGKGTVISLRLPLTLAIVNSILVAVGDHKLLIPLLRISKILDIHGQMISQEEGVTYLVSDGKQMRYFRLGELLGIQHQPARILVYEYGNELVALGVDEVLSRDFILVNKPDARLSSIPGVGGTTVMGDGQVRVVLDVESILKGRE